MKLSHATDHKKSLLLGFFFFSFTIFYFSLSVLSFYSELCCWNILPLNFYEKKYCHCNLSLRKKKKINIISVQLSLELGDLYYTFGSRAVADAICKVLNLKFWNLYLSKTIKHLVCHYSFIQTLF